MLEGDLLQQMFLPFEVEEIRSIPLSNTLPLDKLIWTGTSNGLFIVRSAYKIAMELSCSSVIASTSDDSKQRCFWKTIWRLPAPHKVRHSYGVLAVIYFQQKLIYGDNRCYQKIFVRNAS